MSIGRSLLALILLASIPAVHAAGFSVTSPDVQEGGTIANEQVYNGFGCSGDNVSPALSWSGAPAGTKSFAVTLYDPDAPTGSGWWHWLVFNIPASVTALAKGAGRSIRRHAAGRQRSKPHGFRPTRLRRTLPPARRRTAPLHLHRLRAEDRPPGDRQQRARRDGGLQPARGHDRQGDVDRDLREVAAQPGVGP